jgi:hypothetical protein
MSKTDLKKQQSKAVIESLPVQSLNYGSHEGDSTYAKSFTKFKSPNSQQQVEPVKDYNVVFSDKLENLNFPKGLKLKPLGDADNPVDEIEARLVGLPGNLELDLKTTQRYFGTDARDKFFHRFQWLSAQRLKTAITPGEDLQRLYFENEGEVNGLLDHIPFGPVRKDSGENSRRIDFCGRLKHMDESGYPSDNVLITQGTDQSCIDEEDLDDAEEEMMMKELEGQQIELEASLGRPSNRMNNIMRPTEGSIRFSMQYA